jgi:hypothetical protein
MIADTDKKKAAINPHFHVVTFKTPVLWQNGKENHLYNPRVRYVVNGDAIRGFQDALESRSLLSGSTKLNNIDARDLNGKHILVERHHNRGIGDFLFMTGPIKWLRSRGAQIHVYTSNDKLDLFANNTDLYGEMAYAGPIVYDSLDQWNYHWFIESVTEFSGLADQTNVYDNLFKKIGVDPKEVPAIYKRPYLYLDPSSTNHLTGFLNYLAIQSGEAIGRYVIVAPFSNSSLRSAPYGLWLELVSELSKDYHVFVVGSAAGGYVPTTDMTFKEFYTSINRLAQENKRIVDLVCDMELSMLKNVVSRANFVVTLDTGILYVAQALNIPAISLWGTHNPELRIADKRYLDLAIHKREACPYSPCLAFEGFPRDKCPTGINATYCAPLGSVSVNDILEKVEKI